jgi:hypothetical protein
LSINETGVVAPAGVSSKNFMSLAWGARKIIGRSSDPAAPATVGLWVLAGGGGAFVVGGVFLLMPTIFNLWIKKTIWIPLLSRSVRIAQSPLFRLLRVSVVSYYQTRENCSWIRPRGPAGLNGHKKRQWASLFKLNQMTTTHAR